MKLEEPKVALIEEGLRQFMRSKKTVRWTLVLSAGLLVALGGLWFAATRRVPSYGGVSLTRWLERASDEAPDAEEAVRKIGTNAIPSLVRMLRTRHSKPVESLLQKLAERGVQGSAVQQHMLGYAGFHALGSVGEPAIPSLMPLLEDEDASRWAALSLVAIGPSGTRKLTNALTNPNTRIKCNILMAFANAHSDGRFAVTVLSNHISDPDYRIRFAAAQSLGYLKSEPMTAVPALTKAIQDTNRAVRFIALEGIGRFGDAASNAVDVVAEAANEQDPLVRRAAISALREIRSR